MPPISDIKSGMTENIVSYALSMLYINKYERGNISINKSRPIPNVGSSKISDFCYCSWYMEQLVNIQLIGMLVDGNYFSEIR